MTIKDAGIFILLITVLISVTLLIAWAAYKTESTDTVPAQSGLTALKPAQSGVMFENGIEYKIVVIEGHRFIALPRPQNGWHLVPLPESHPGCNLGSPTEEAE